jgi:undecaprenyl-diphosphatase
MMQKDRSVKFISGKKVIWAAAGFLLFSVIAYFISSREVLAFDTIIRQEIYSLRNDTLTIFLKVFTYMGNWQTVTLICCALLFIRRLRFSFGFPAALTAVICTLIQDTLKLMFQRIRPDVSLHLIEQGGYSFPSGHSFTNFVFFGMIIFLCRRKLKNKATTNWITVLLGCLVFLIGFSRIYLGVHFPTDVLGGWALGLSLIMILTSALDFLQKNRRI